ncbi:hypothetical protein GXM_04889 [Nostoc sphaeroides CCNUC1]|uniref:Uncharacterized protein n=1 Tax=Nostoc sphaeroides CCNUC1 TaxID=2653204 RepID=A0A5P8W3R5_9NOSO|nr:hypothetical protein GXM_04889 [Nostoc sphaeroides CCNUC1]
MDRFGSGNLWLTFRYFSIFSETCISSKYKAVLQGRGFQPISPIKNFVPTQVRGMLTQQF